MNFAYEAILQWVIPTLLTLKSSRLEYICVGGCVISDQHAVRSQFLALDRVLTEGPGMQTLKRVEIMDCTIEDDRGEGASYEYKDNFLRRAFPTCHAHKLLYGAQGAENPL